MERQHVPVSVRYSGELGFAELAPMLDELKLHFWTVEASAGTPDGSARGGAVYVPLDIVFEFARYAVDATATGIIGALAYDGSKRLLSAILEFRNKDREPYGQQGVRPFGIRIGSLWLMYEGPLTDDEFSRSLDAALPLAESLTDLEKDAFIGQYFWDSSSERWKGPVKP